MRTIELKEMSEKDVKRFFRSFNSTHGCWLWAGTLDKNGYGLFRYGRKSFRAPRIAYKVFCGVDPGQLHVCHSCDVPRCVNPDHLFLGTNADNTNDKVAKGRHGIGEANGQSKLSTEDILFIRSSNKTQKELAAQFGVVPSVIGNVRLRLRWKHIDDGLGKICRGKPRGERNHKSKLKEPDIVGIRLSEDSNVGLAKKFGVDQSVISRIRARKTWRHVP